MRWRVGTSPRTAASASRSSRPGSQAGGPVSHRGLGPGAGHLGPDRLWALRERVREIQGGVGTPDRAAPQGIVVTHGTDVLEETAYLLARTLDPRVPIALTAPCGPPATMAGTVREIWWTPPPSRRAAEARGAALWWSSPGKVFAGHQAVKIHTVDPDAFAAPHGMPVGRVGDGGPATICPPARLPG